MIPNHHNHKGWNEITNASTEDLIFLIIKYKKINNAIKSVVFKELIFRYPLYDFGDKHKDTEENIKKLKKFLPEYFL